MKMLAQGIAAGVIGTACMDAVIDLAHRLQPRAVRDPNQREEPASEPWKPS